jgi:3-methyladenine DNA glycosylase AlkD
MVLVTEVISQLEEFADPDVICKRRDKYGIISSNALGVTHAQINLIVKNIRRDTALGIALYNTGIYEAKLLCAKICDPKTISREQIERFSESFKNWEIVDCFCMQLICKTEYAREFILEWSCHADEFIKRAAFTLIASLCIHDKKGANAIFIPYFDLIRMASIDDRHYVMKAVSWALRGLGKRNKDLHGLAYAIAEELIKHSSRSAQWIGKDALKEFHRESFHLAGYPRSSK